LFQKVLGDPLAASPLPAPIVRDIKHVIQSKSIMYKDCCRY